MLRVNLGALAEGAVVVDVEVPADDELFGGLEFSLARPVHVRGRLSPAGERDFYLHGAIGATIRSECRRCLEPVTVPVSSELDAVFTLDERMEDPSVYLIPERATELDLGSMVREELILAIPGFAVCRDDCKGLCAGCGVNLNSGECTCEPAGDSRWAALRQLQDTLTEERGNDGGTKEKNIT